jgi:hypothetical protein
VLHTTYVYKQLPLSPWEATKAAETWKGSVAPLCRTSRFARANQRLWLTSQLRDGGMGEILRQASGVLWFRGRPIRVAFELSVWSDSATIIGLRTLRLRPVMTTERYEASAYGILEGIASHLLSVASSEVHRPFYGALPQPAERMGAASHRRVATV